MKVLNFIIIIFFISCNKNNSTIEYNQWETKNKIEINPKIDEIDTRLKSNFGKIYFINIVNNRNKYMPILIDSIKLSFNQINKIDIIESFGRSKKYNATIKINNSDDIYKVNVVNNKFRFLPFESIDSKRFDIIYSYICSNEENKNIDRLDIIEIHSQLELKQSKLFCQKSCSYFTTSTLE